MPTSNRVGAEELVESGVRVVVNVAPSQTGRFPNPGPLELVRSGVRLIEFPGADLFEKVLGSASSGLFEALGSTGTERAWPPGTSWPWTASRERSTTARPRHRGAAVVCGEHAALPPGRGRLLTEPVELPHLRTRLRDRHALVVARGPGHKRDLRMVGTYVRNYRPVLIGVDGGADAIIEAGWKPDLIVGDMDSVSDGALRSGAEVVVHAYSEGDAPGAERLQALGIPFQTVSVPGISEDVAFLVAFEKGAQLIVAVGTHFNLIEFLERDREGMSSTFVTRLKVGEILIDAKGVSRLVTPRVGLLPLVVLTLVGLLAMVVAVLASPALRSLIEDTVRTLL